MLSLFQNRGQKQAQSERRLDDQIERCETAIRMASEAEERGDTSKAAHFLDVAIREEAKAFS